jgi:hypothetical protein
MIHNKLQGARSIKLSLTFSIQQAREARDSRQNTASHTHPQQAGALQGGSPGQKSQPTRQATLDASGSFPYTNLHWALRALRQQSPPRHRHLARQETQPPATQGGHRSPPRRAPEGDHLEPAGCWRCVSQHLSSRSCSSVRSSSSGGRLKSPTGDDFYVTDTSTTVMPDSNTTTTSPRAPSHYT